MTNIDFYGICHDGQDGATSQGHRRFASGQIQGRLVGDSAYRAEPFLIKIFAGSNLDSQHRNYNKAICKFRSCVEQSFGQLKRQFHALHATLRCSPERAPKLIATAICLRNVAVGLLEPDFGEKEEENFEDYDSDVEQEGMEEYLMANLPI
ncbi:hypothetical protein ANCDUO_12530 [Ancylostoma duodenale]|uniref:DDE Tnp4 domain-containing protein n=1 Tax=Ancylostoma duodenale TaxID=51022 RepID=A0A0C2G8H4_9BILA|nr:hypothetical protein ANCDUO_12530 [Ancylostoma duodenale]